MFFVVRDVIGQAITDSSELVLKSKFEIGFTPRFAGIRDFVISPTDSGFYYSVSWYRLHGGIEVMESQYVHLFFDYFRLRTDLEYKDNSIDAFGYGIQYSLKFEEALVTLPPIRLYKKPIRIRWYPELSAGIGFIDLANNSYRLSGWHQSTAYYAFYQYGIAWNFYFNDWGHISILYFQEYFPSFSHDPYHYSPLQIKLVIKL